VSGRPSGAAGSYAGRIAASSGFRRLHPGDVRLRDALESVPA